MKKITFSADENLLELAREVAHARNTTFNAMFRGWLMELAATQEQPQEAADLLQRISYVNSGGRFSRDEMNKL